MTDYWDDRDRKVAVRGYERALRRDRKRRKRQARDMRVSGRSVFLIQEAIAKRGRKEVRRGKSDS